MSKSIFIVECRNARRDVISYSIEAESETEARDIFEVMKNNGETFSKVREVITRYEHNKDKLL